MKNNNSAKITEDFLSIFKSKLESGESETNIRKFVKESLGLSKSRGNEVYNEIKQNLEYAENYGLAFVSDKYVYNQNTDTYVINLKCKKSPLCISGAKHRAICRSYSSWIDDLSVNEICVKYSITPEVFAEYRKIFGLTKDREPLSAEEVIENSVDESVKSIVEEKRFKIYQGYEKELWKDTQVKAAKWDRFNTNRLDVLKLSLDGWEPPVGPIKKKNKEVKSGEVVICGLSDNHLGERYRISEGFSGRDFDSKVACEIIDEYSCKIEDLVRSRNKEYKEAYLIITGDFLNSNFNGCTTKGTHLHNDVINQEMFRIGLDALTRFIGNFASLFPKVKIISVRANHDDPIFLCLMYAILRYYENNPNIEFDISESWAILRRIGNIGTIITHGGHPTLKNAGLPPVSTKLKTLVQEMFLQKTNELQGVTQRCVISGHRHAYSQMDLGSFEFYCLGSSVIGDSFADANSWYNTPRQNFLIADENHILESCHVYF